MEVAGGIVMAVGALGAIAAMGSMVVLARRAR
jgi:hypothetical protein